jgi:hypothetical protein
MAEKPKRPEKRKGRSPRAEVVRGPKDEVLRRTEDLEKALDRLLKKKPG